MGRDYSELQREAVAGLEYGSAGAAGVATVPMASSFRGDVRRCLTSVVFVPSATAKGICDEVSRPLREAQPEHHYHPPASLHVTIKNVRTAHAPPLFGEGDVRECQRVFAEVTARHSGFRLQLRLVTTLAASVAVIGFCDERLRDLVLDLDRELRAAGVADNKAYVSDSVFFGNVTVCRFTVPPSGDFLRAVGTLRDSFAADLPVSAISLITCDSVCSRGSLRVIQEFGLSPAGRC